MSSKAPLLAVFAVISIFAGITGVQLAYTLAYVLLLLLVVAWVWSQLLARRLEVHRETPEGAHMVGEAFTERFTLRNRSVLTLPYCQVNDRTRIPGYAPGLACALSPGGAVAWTARGVFTQRGKLAFGPLEVRLGDPFGLFHKTVRLPRARAAAAGAPRRPLWPLPQDGAARGDRHGDGLPRDPPGRRGAPPHLDGGLLRRRPPRPRARHPSGHLLGP